MTQNISSTNQPAVEPMDRIHAIERILVQSHREWWTYRRTATALLAEARASDGSLRAALERDVLSLPPQVLPAEARHAIHAVLAASAEPTSEPRAHEWPGEGRYVAGPDAGVRFDNETEACRHCPTPDVHPKRVGGMLVYPPADPEDGR